MHLCVVLRSARAQQGRAGQTDGWDGRGANRRYDNVNSVVVAKRN